MTVFTYEAYVKTGIVVALQLGLALFPTHASSRVKIPSDCHSLNYGPVFKALNSYGRY